MRIFRDMGFLAKEPLAVGGVTVRPLDVTAALLFPRWTFEDAEADLTVLRVTVEGRRDGERVRYVWDLLDAYDPATGLRSMSRTTAFPATIVAGLVAAGQFRSPGVNTPEALGAQDGLLEVVLNALEERGVRCASRVERGLAEDETAGELLAAR